MLLCIEFVEGGAAIGRESRWMQRERVDLKLAACCLCLDLWWALVCSVVQQVAMKLLLALVILLQYHFLLRRLPI